MYFISPYALSTVETVIFKGLIQVFRTALGFPTVDQRLGTSNFEEVSKALRMK